MWKILVITLTLTFLTSQLTTRTEATRPSSSTSSRYYRQNLYNFRPQSTLIEDEQDYRSYDNNFADFRGGSSSQQQQSYRPAVRSRLPPPPPVPLPQLNSISSRSRQFIHHDPPPHNFQQDDDDYLNESDLTDDDDIDLDQPILHQTRQNTHYNYRPLIGGGGRRPISPPIAQLQPQNVWSDISGPGRGDASYSFGYDLHDQSRHECADPYGNVNGDFSFVDDGGTFRKISYTAGAEKGFVVNHKVPSDGNGGGGGHQLSPNRRPFSHSIIKKPSNLIPESPTRLPSIRNPSPTLSQQQQQSSTHSSNLANNGDDSDNSGGPGVSKGNNGNSSGGGNRGSGNGQRDQNNNNVVGGSLSSGKPWGVLGQNHQLRPRHMRKRKPALVVKVKRPAQSQAPASWMYYRPPNPGRPLDGSSGSIIGGGTGWQQKSKPLPPPAASSYQDDIGDQGGWSESDNEISDDSYPKDKSYSFGYNTGDQTRQEVSDAWGNIRGSYSYLDPSGVTRTVHYTAGHSGFKILNAQPSIIRPVYTEAPPVQSIPIPIAVAHQIHHPQPSAIVYHIHPDGGAGADWKPWEPTRTSKHGSNGMYQRRRRNRPRSQQILQPNSFHLTHQNHRFFPAYSNIYDPAPQSRSHRHSHHHQHEVDAETIIPTLSRHRIEEDPQFLKHIQQQVRHSNKLKRLQQQYKQQLQQQVFMYTRSRSPSSSSSPRYRQQQQQYQKNRLIHTNIVDDSAGVGDESLTPLSTAGVDDQHFSDYEAAAAIVESNPVTLQRRLSDRKKDRRGDGSSQKKSSNLAFPQQQPQQQQQQEQNSNRNSEVNNNNSNNNNNNNDDDDQQQQHHHSASSSNVVDVRVDNVDPTINTDPGLESTVVPTTAKMVVVENDHDIHDIHPYHGDYGTKNPPLMIITERESSSPIAIRQQRKTSSTDSRAVASEEKPGMTLSDNLAAESMVSPAVAMAMGVVMPTESMQMVQMTSPPPTPQSSSSPSPPPSPQQQMEKMRMMRDHSMEARKATMMTTTTSSSSSTTMRMPRMSPATLLAAKMSSAPAPKMTSISAITIPGRLMHYGAKMEPLNNSEGGSKESDNQNN